jgi:hypothetical protein
MGHISFLAYADDVIVVGENIATVQKKETQLLCYTAVGMLVWK